jgi:integrase/recombinase XerD
VPDLAKFTRRTPDTVTRAHPRACFEHLVTERQLAPASIRLAYHGIRFFDLEVLTWPAPDLEVTLSKRPRRIPGLLTRTAVAAIRLANARPLSEMSPWQGFRTFFPTVEIALPRV